MERRWRATRGYTLLELLVVMMIIGLLAALASVRMGPALNRARVRGAASVLAGDLQYAQVLAARNRVPMLVSVDGGALTYQIADRDGTVYRERALGDSSEYRLDALSSSPATLQIFPNAVAAEPVTYTLGAAGYERQVTFSRAGQIRVTTVP
jgi:type II secretion system protein H